MIKSNTRHAVVVGTALMAVLMTVLAVNAQTGDNKSKFENWTALNRSVKTPSETSSVKTSPLPTLPRKKAASSDAFDGWYAGGYAGVSLGRGSAHTTTIFSPTGYFATTSVPAINTTGRQILNPNRFTVGGTLGYNHRSNDWVVGGETDFGIITGTTTTTGTATYPCCAPTAFTITQTLRQRWLWTARGRVGFVSGNTLFYLTGGLSVTRINYQERFTDTFATALETGGLIRTKVGFNGGGGIEQMINDHWSIKGEYLYTDFRRSTTTSTNLTAFTPPTAFPSNVYTHSIFLSQHDLRFGFNYHW